MDWSISRLHITEESISELEDMSIETSQNGRGEGKETKQNKMKKIRKKNTKTIQ